MFDVRERSTRSWQNSSQQARRREARAGVHDSHFFGAIECGVGPCKPAVHGPGSDLGWRYRHFQWLWQANTFLHLQQLATRLGLDLTELSRSVAQLSCAFFFSVFDRFFNRVSGHPNRDGQSHRLNHKQPARRPSVHLELKLSHKVLRGKGWEPMAKWAITPYRHSHREDRGSSETRTGHGVADLEPSRDVASDFCPARFRRHDARPNTTGNIHVQHGQGQPACSLHRYHTVKFMRRHCLTSIVFLSGITSLQRKRKTLQKRS